MASPAETQFSERSILGERVHRSVRAGEGSREPVHTHLILGGHHAPRLEVYCLTTPLIYFPYFVKGRSSPTPSNPQGPGFSLGSSPLQHHYYPPYRESMSISEMHFSLFPKQRLWPLQDPAWGGAGSVPAAARTPLPRSCRHTGPRHSRARAPLIPLLSLKVWNLKHSFLLTLFSSFSLPYATSAEIKLAKDHRDILFQSSCKSFIW